MLRLENHLRRCQIFINALIYFFALSLLCVCFIDCALLIVWMRKCFFPDLLSHSFIRTPFIFAYNFRALDNMLALLVLYRYFMVFFSAVFLKFPCYFRFYLAFWIFSWFFGCFCCFCGKKRDFYVFLAINFLPKKSLFFG